jgi:DNA-binding NarL/FixJ family response regulator
LRFVAVGRTYREIARELFLSPRTVDMHACDILDKLDCRSRTEATHRADEGPHRLSGRLARRQIRQFHA